ncbi:hypothetical protein ACFX19_030864 [Malus domestica]
MDHCLAFSTLKLHITTASFPPAVQSRTANCFFRPLTVVTGAKASHYEFRSFNLPLDLHIRPEKDLCTVL